MALPVSGVSDELNAPPKGLPSFAQMILTACSLPEMAQMVRSERDLEIQIEKRFLKDAKVCMGQGFMEERLLRLMAWVGDLSAFCDKATAGVINK